MHCSEYIISALSFDLKICLSGFAKLRYLQDFLATVLFEACSVDYFFLMFSIQKKTQQAVVDRKQANKKHMCF